MSDSRGCYICQPDNPDASEDGCAECERDYVTWLFASEES